MGRANIDSDEESEEFNSSTSSLEFIQSNPPRLPHIPLATNAVVLDADHHRGDSKILPDETVRDLPPLVYPPLFDKIAAEGLNLSTFEIASSQDARNQLASLTTDKSDDASDAMHDLWANLKYLNQATKDEKETGDGGIESPIESEELDSSRSSINLGTKKVVALAPRVNKDDSEDNVEDVALSEEDSEECNSSSSVEFITTKIPESHAPRIVSVFDDRNLLEELEEMISPASVNVDLDKKFNYTVVNPTNIDSPLEESDELNSSNSSINYKNNVSTTVAPRPAKVDVIARKQDESKVKIPDDSPQFKSIQRKNTDDVSSAESEEFMSSTSSVAVNQQHGLATFKPRQIDVLKPAKPNAMSQSEESHGEIKLFNKPGSLNDSPEDLGIADSIKVASKSGTVDQRSLSMEPDSKINSLSDIQPGSGSKSKEFNHHKQFKPRDSAAIDYSKRTSRLNDISSSESSAVSSTSDDQDQNADAETDEEFFQPISSKPISKEKYYRCRESMVVSKPRHLSVIEDIGYYFSLLDKKCYFSGFIYKKNELGSNGESLKKTNILRRYGTIERGGEWVKYWGEIVGTVLILWKVSVNMDSDIYTNNAISPNNSPSKYTPGKGINDLIQAEIFPSLGLIKDIKAKCTPFALQLFHSSCELIDQLPFGSDMLQNTPPPPIPYTSFFTLSNLGKNKYAFASPSYVTSLLWIKAMHLSVYENDQINIAFSLKLLKEPRYLNVWTDLGIAPFSCVLRHYPKPLEGLVEARHAMDLEFQKYYLVIAQEKPEPIKRENNRRSTFFGRIKPDNSSPEVNDPETELNAPTGLILLYREEADHVRGLSPVVKIENVHTAFLIWPRADTASHNEFVTSIKVYGDVSYPPAVEAQKKKDKKNRTTFADRQTAEIFHDSFIDNVAKTGESFFIISLADTQVSLRFLVSIWNAFGIETNLDSCANRERFWSEPPANWGPLSLRADESLHELRSSNFRTSYKSLDKILHDKFTVFKMGLAEEWTSSINNMKHFNDQIEKEEILFKAEELMKVAGDITKAWILPKWLKSEFLNRNLNVDEQEKLGKGNKSEIKTPTRRLDKQSPTKTSEGSDEISPAKESEQKSPTNRLQKQSPTDKSEQQSPTNRSQEQSPTNRSQEQSPTNRSQEQSPTDKSEQQSPTKSLAETPLNPISNVNSLNESDTPRSPVPPPRGITLSMNLTKALKTSSESSLSSSASDDSSSQESITPTSERSCVDLTRTIPLGLNMDIGNLVSKWTTEQSSRLQSHQAWISNASGNYTVGDSKDNLDPEKLIFDPKSLLGTGFQPRAKKAAIQGPLISAIPTGDSDNMKNVPFTDGLVGNTSTNNSNKNGRHRSETLLSSDKLDNYIGKTSFGKDLEEMIFRDGLLGQKKEPATNYSGYGPLISAIRHGKEEVKPVQSLDQGLVGQMQSRESIISKSKTPSRKEVSRQSHMSHFNGDSAVQLNPSFHSNQAPFYYGQNLSTFNPGSDANVSMNPYAHFYTPYFSQNPNAPTGHHGNQMGYIPIEYHQAVMYQQYMYALESQRKSKHKKKSKKKKDKKKKQKDGIPNMDPQFYPFYPQNYSASMPQGNNIQSTSVEATVLPIEESSSEESDQSL